MPRSDELRFAVAALAAMLCAVPATASLPPATDVPMAAPASPDEVGGIARAAVARFEAQDCVGVLALLDPLVPRIAPGRQRLAVQLLRLRCLGATGRVGEIDALQKELEVAAPRDPAVRSMGVMIAAQTGRYGDAADQLSAIATDQPTILSLIPATLWRVVAQRLAEAGDLARRDKALVTLAAADWQPVNRPEMREGIAQGAIKVLLDRKDVPAAEALLPRVESPDLLTDMAVERRYRPLWPAIESRLGPHGEIAVDSFAARRLDDFANSPADTRARRDAIRAFIFLGRLDDAIELGEQVAVSPAMDENDIDAVRFEAQALASSGDRAKAAARLAAVAALDSDKLPEATSATVMLAEMLDEDGRSEEALKAARDGIAHGDKALSPWGVAWVRRTEVCALSKLGRIAEERGVGDALKAKAYNNEAAAIEGLLCAHRIDEAAAIAAKTLATGEGAERLADQFQPEPAFWAPAPSRLRAMWVPLLRRPEVKAAFDRSARLLPGALWPLRAARPLPRLPGRAAGPTT